MDIRTAITSRAGAGAAENARRSLDQWSRAEDEVSALLDRLGRLDSSDGAPARAPTGPTTTAA